MTEVMGHSPSAHTQPGSAKSGSRFRRPSDAQLWILCRASEGAEVVAGSGYSVHQSLFGKPTYYGAPAQSHAKCVAAGWLLDNRITDAGREVLQAVDDENERAKATTTSSVGMSEANAPKSSAETQTQGGERE